MWLCCLVCGACFLCEACFYAMFVFYAVPLQRSHIPSSPRSRSVSNVADAKLVKYLVKRRRFQGDSLWNMAALSLVCWLLYFCSFLLYLNPPLSFLRLGIGGTCGLIKFYDYIFLKGLFLPCFLIPMFSSLSFFPSPFSAIICCIFCIRKRWLTWNWLGCRFGFMGILTLDTC